MHKTYVEEAGRARWGRERKEDAGVDARESREKVDLVLTSYFLGVEKKPIARCTMLALHRHKKMLISRACGLHEGIKSVDFCADRPYGGIRATLAA
jgi:hypothetical protein